MSEAPASLRCPECGSSLAISLLPDGSVNTGGLTVTFRRHTDHVVCDRCLFSHRVDEFRRQPVSGSTV
jgi:hypothetical protein